MHLFHAKYSTNIFTYLCTKLVYLKSAKLEQLILHINCTEVLLKSN